jgi:hypothetical protein
LSSIPLTIPFCVEINTIQFPFLKVGMITRGNVVSAALKIKKKTEEGA